jgi:hypothetical protein
MPTLPNNRLVGNSTRRIGKERRDKQQVGADFIYTSNQEIQSNAEYMDTTWLVVN